MIQNINRQNTVLLGNFFFLSLIVILISCHKEDEIEFWYHRVNDIKKFDSLNHKQVKGIEFDICYDTSINSIVVAHDFYQKKPHSTLKEYLKKWNHKSKLWIDFKYQNKESREQIIKFLDKEINNTDRHLIFVESIYPHFLHQITKLNFNALYTYQEANKSLLFRLREQIMIYRYNIKGLAIFINDIEKQENIFPISPQYGYTIKNKEVLKQYSIKTTNKISVMLIEK